MYRFGGAHILHAHDADGFANDLMTALARIWDYPIVMGRELFDFASHSVALVKEFLIQWFCDKSRSEEEKTHWDQQLDRIAYSVNCTVSAEGGKSPYEQVFGHKPKMGPVFPGLSHNVVRETFKRSFVREEELEKNERNHPLSFKHTSPIDLNQAERPYKLLRREGDSRKQVNRTEEDGPLGRTSHGNGYVNGSADHRHDHSMVNLSRELTSASQSVQ
mmetsp:Transcript_640/g.2136  ORF Transcript_640/g.2136 Transcript_640/m.2136 type:complete len:218 (-) Transcript_640:643-1296(-)